MNNRIEMVVKNGKNWGYMGDDCYMPMDVVVGGCSQNSKVRTYYFPKARVITFTGEKYYDDHTTMHFQCDSFEEAEWFINKCIKAVG